MRLTMTRITVFCFSVGLGLAVAGVLSHNSGRARLRSALRQTAQAGNNALTTQPVSQEDDALQTGSHPSIRFMPMQVLGTGYTNVESLVLRERPEAAAKSDPVLKLTQMESVEILGAARDYLRVRLLAKNAPADDDDRSSDLEGWVAWGEVMPNGSAIVLDAETGEVSMRLPFGDVESHSNPMSIAFAPDNSKALFYTYGLAYELNTEDYSLRSAFKLDTEAELAGLPVFFYGAPDNTLYAAVLTNPAPSQHAGESLLQIVRVNTEADINDGPTPVFSDRAAGFVLSPNGRTGFILHPANAEESVLIDIFDPQSMKVSNTLTLHGKNPIISAENLVINDDGSRLYMSLDTSRDVISVIDANGGRTLREIPTGSLNEEARYLNQQELVGDSLLIRVWDGEGHDTHNFWLSGGKPQPAQKGIDLAVEAKGVRLAVNDSGTHLFKLDTKNRIQARYGIDRPELRINDGGAEGFGVYNLFASPDALHLILIIGMIDMC